MRKVMMQEHNRPLIRLFCYLKLTWSNKMGVGQILVDFSGWTSAHGIPHIGSAQNFILRVFWTVIFLGSSVMFGTQMIQLIQKYLAYDVTVQTELKFEERSFPAVTVCSLNAYRRTQVYENNLVPKMKLLMDTYQNAMKKTNLNFTHNNQFASLNDLHDRIDIQSKTQDYLMLLAAELNRTSPELLHNITYGGHEDKEFIMNCAYNTKPCVPEYDFQKIIDPVYGACYTFNNNPDQNATVNETLYPSRGAGIYKSTRAGPLYGLRLLLKSDQREYLPITESAGVRVSVHGQGEEPFPDAFGYNAAAGFTTSFGIKFIRTTRLPSPYGNCATDGKVSGSYYYGGTYSVEGCFRSCFQDHIYGKCKCYDPRFGTPKQRQYCTLKKKDVDVDVNCINKYSSKGEDSNFNQITSCNCPQPCNESTYSVTVSAALWPSTVYEPPPADCPKDLNGTDPKTWYKHNTMLLEVYYERMNYQLLSESEAYSIVNLVSDMGGQLGLWMGVSVITVVEFVALLVLLCLYFVARKRGADQDDDESDDEEDEKKKPEPEEKPPPNTDNSPPPPYYDGDINDFPAPPPPK